MQNYIEQAEKKKIHLLNHGPCQFCGSKVIGGIDECVNLSSMVTHYLDHKLGIHTNCLFITVDAHALSHAEIHGRWNNHFHLTRLYLILIKEIKWDYYKSPQLSRIINAYKKTHLDEFLQATLKDHKEDLTVLDLANARSKGEYITLSFKWAKQVFNTYESSHDTAKALAQRFLEAYS